MICSNMYLGGSSLYNSDLLTLVSVLFFLIATMLGSVYHHLWFTQTFFFLMLLCWSKTFSPKILNSSTGSVKFFLFLISETNPFEFDVKLFHATSNFFFNSSHIFSVHDIMGLWSPLSQTPPQNLKNLSKFAIIIINYSCYCHYYYHLYYHFYYYREITFK